MNDNSTLDIISNSSDDLDVSDASPDTSGSDTNGSDNSDSIDYIDNDSVDNDSSSDFSIDLSPLQESFGSLETALIQSNDTTLDALVSIDTKLTCILVILIAFVALTVFRKLFDCFR